MAAHNRLETKSFPIWINRVIDLPPWSLGDKLSDAATVKYTNLVSARLLASINADCLGSWSSMYMNGSKVFDYWQTPEYNIDVTDRLQVGLNTFVYNVGKIIGTWGTYTVNMSLIIDADNATVTPPLPWPLEEWWFPYAVAGGVLTVAGAYMLKRRRPHTAQYKRRTKS